MSARKPHIPARWALVFGALAAAALISSSCGRGQVEFAEISTHPRALPADVPPPVCGRAEVPGMTEDPGDTPAGVPYPTPSAGEVKPGITGIPLPAGAVQIDGFKTTKGRDTAVQVFEVALTEDEVLAFFDEAMKNQGWSIRLQSQSPAGVACEFLPALTRDGIPPENWIEVATEYVPRSGEEPSADDLPPGFRGKGVPFAPRTPGKTTFSILTPG